MEIPALYGCLLAADACVLSSSANGRPWSYQMADMSCDGWFCDPLPGPCYIQTAACRMPSLTSHPQSTPRLFEDEYKYIHCKCSWLEAYLESRNQNEFLDESRSSSSSLNTRWLFKISFSIHYATSQTRSLGFNSRT